MATTAEKVEAIYATLDDDERATLLDTGSVTSRDDLPPALRDRLEALTKDLTAEDKAEIVAAVHSAEAGEDVEGFGWGTVVDHRTPGFGDASNVRDHRAGSTGFVSELHQVYDIFAKIF